MKKLLFIACLVCFSVVDAQDIYKVSIDLTKAREDKVPVEVSVPVIESEQVEYHMAKIVPGTYSISDFGRFVVSFRALDAEGNKLKVDRTSTNRWTIHDATRLAKITYWIEDSFDEFEGYGDNKVFEPGGMGIDAVNNVYVMNTFGFVGYIDGLKFRPYELTIRHDEKIYGATSLKRKDADNTTDTFVAENFNFLADAPIMYSEPDTISKNVAGAKVLVSVYSPNKKLSAANVMDNIDELMEAQAEYLGGTLPVDRYAYLIYLFDGPTISNSWGALEHSYSSLYTLPERDPERISQTVKDVAAHEFFHILTPLNIHSEEIHDFNYIEPEMSQHLWLYEGVTEYAANHVQVKHGLFGVEKFLEEMKQKLNVADYYNVDVPFTYFSEHILDDDQAPKYGDVYNKGALIGMCLDLTIIHHSDGEKDLQWLMRELAKKYGPQRAFKDEELFGEIERLTYPEVGEFLEAYVGGTEPLPLTKVLGWAGVDYTAKVDEQIATLGEFTSDLNEDQEIYVKGMDEANEFAEDLGLQVGDVLVEWNGTELTLENADQVAEEFYKTANEGDKVIVLVRRNLKGKVKYKKLKAKAMMVPQKENHVLVLSESPTADQVEVRKAWLGL